jgi:hypothetical protein
MNQEELLSKSDFKKFLECPFYLWLWKYHKDLLSEEILKPEGKYIDEGKEVDELSKGLFPDAVEIKEFGEAAWKKTQELIKKRTPVLIQPTVIAGELMSRADFLVYNQDHKNWDLYEVKSSTDVKKGSRKKWYENHLIDVAFQRICWERAGVKIGATSIIFVNRNFVRNGDVIAEFCGEERGAKGFFVKENVSGSVSEFLSQVEAEIEKALASLKSRKDVREAARLLCPDHDDCPFLRELPPATLKSIGVELVKVEGKDCRDLTHLKTELQKLKYPLYFFDYETYDAAIPLFDGFRPYQKFAFQYSLHIKAAPDAKVEHKYFLCDTYENPIPGLLKQLKKDIGPKGTVLVWYEPFEKTRNEEMAKMHSEYAVFLHAVNERVFDLMKVFKKESYWRKEFGGSKSLKVVAPVLVPELLHSELVIQEGQTASESWKKLVAEDLPEADRAKLKNDMLLYCGRDTEVMVKILDLLELDLASDVK